MLIDTSNCCDHHVNDVIEDLFYKAASEPPDIWEPHQSPFIRRMIELFTERGLFRLSQMQDELLKWLNNEFHKSGAERVTPPGAVERWTPAEMALVRLYLTSLPVSEFTADDWMMCVDYLHQRYWPADQVRAEAEWLAVRASIMGRVQARMNSVSESQSDKILAAAPVTAAAVERELGMTAAQAAMLDYGKARATQAIVTLADGVRQRAKAHILAYHQAVALGEDVPRESLETRLFDNFASAGADWRRIAMTETVELSGQGLISSLPLGTIVRRIEQYRGACPFCRKIDGMEFEVVSPDESNKDPWRMMWIGKTNIGRSAAPRKRVGGVLVEREPHELWIPTPGAIHPYCRGQIISINKPDFSGDKKFTQWMNEVLNGDND